MSNEPIKPIEQNYVPYETLFPNAVLGGVEVKDDLTDSNNTWSSEKISNELSTLNDDLTQAIETAISGIDLSPYQLTSAKDTRNGYLGFTNNVIVVDVNFLQNNLVYSNPYLYSSSAATGAGSYTSGGSVNTPKLRSGNDTQFRLPTLNLVGSVTGNVTCALNGIPAMTFKSPYKALFEQTVSFTDIGTKNNTFVIIAGDAARGSTTFTGSGLIFILNPLQNSGKWRVGKVVSTTPTYYNTDTSPTYNNSTKFSIYYNKATEEALFYIDDTLVYTMTSVNLSDTTNFTLKMSLVREDSTETVATYATPVRQTIIYDLR